MPDEVSLLHVDEDVKEELVELKESRDDESWDEFIRFLVEESDQLDFDEVPTMSEFFGLGMGTFTAMQDPDTGFLHKVTQGIVEFRTREMAEENQKVVECALEKARAGEPLDETERRMLKSVAATEG